MEDFGLLCVYSVHTSKHMLHIWLQIAFNCFYLTNLWHQFVWWTMILFPLEMPWMLDQTTFVQSIGFGRQEVWIGFLPMCNREVGQALSRGECLVRTVDLEPELHDSCVGVANLEIFFCSSLFNTGLDDGRWTCSKKKAMNVGPNNLCSNNWFC